MDGGLNKIATAVIGVFAVTFLALVAQILYILCRSRRQQQQQTSAKERVYLFCWRIQSRVEPNEIESRGEDDSAAAGDEVEKWRELCGPSRALFTIKEEEEREGIMECLKDHDTTPFHTPCASPPYYTPSASPPRGSSDHSPTTPFYAIQISTH